MLDDSVGTTYSPSCTVAKPAQDVIVKVLVRVWLAQHRHRIHSCWLLTTTLVAPKVTPRDEALAPSAQPDVAAAPVHSRMLLLLLFFLSDMKLSTFTSELFAALFTTLVLILREYGPSLWSP